MSLSGAVVERCDCESCDQLLRIDDDDDVAAAVAPMRLSSSSLLSLPLECVEEIQLEIACRSCTRALCEPQFICCENPSSERERKENIVN